MKKRMRLRKAWIRFNNKSKISLTIFLILVCTFLSVSFIKNKIEGLLSTLAENEITNISTYIVNEAVNESVKTSVNVENTTKMVTNKDGEIVSIDFDTIKVNKILNNVNNVVLSLLKNLESGKYEELENDVLKLNDDKITYYIPYGVVTGNPLLANIGPRIPIKINVIGSIVSNISTSLTPYGINNSLFKLSIAVETNIRFIMPFVSKNIKIKSEVPVIIKIINGKVPDVYGSNYAVNSPLIES